MYIFCVNIFSISRFSSNFASSWIPPGSTFSYLLGVRDKLMRQQPLGERQLQNG